MRIASTRNGLLAALWEIPRCALTRAALSATRPLCPACADGHLLAAHDDLNAQESTRVWSTTRSTQELSPGSHCVIIQRSPACNPGLALRLGPSFSGRRADGTGRPNWRASRHASRCTDPSRRRTTRRRRRCCPLRATGPDYLSGARCSVPADWKWGHRTEWRVLTRPGDRGSRQ